jgi:uncharacterized protein
MPLPQPVIDGFEFALAGATRTGIWPIAAFPRLRDMLASELGEASYEVQGVRDELGRPALRVQVCGRLQLRCQRCLEVLDFDARTDETLVLAQSQAEIDAEPANVHAADRVVAGREMPLRDLVEDELLLALPYAPRHESCSPVAAGDGQETTSPFAGLRGLVRGRH